MKSTCRKCGKILVVPTWKTCNECDTLKRTGNKKPKSNPYLKKYQEDTDTLEYLQRNHPAGKPRR